MSILDRLKTAAEDPEEKKPQAPAAPAQPEAAPAPAPAAPSLLKPREPQAAPPGKETKDGQDAPAGDYDPLSLAEPRTAEDLGIRPDFLMPHVLKTVAILDTFTVNEAAEQLCLPLKITNDLLEEWRNLKCMEVASAAGYAATTRRYVMTSEGRNRAREYMRLSGYMGAVPVPMTHYVKMVHKQSVLGVQVDIESLKKALSHLVVSDRLFKPLGPAVNSGRTIFLYGPPGNGKTAIAVALSSLLGGAIAIPKAIEVDGFVIRLYDPSVHSLDEGPQPEDKRWLRCKRPAVVVGGELTLQTMELQMDPHSSTYEAPPHVKSNNGIFILDDFGRQLVRPRDLLNRWIVPLENRVDFLTLHTGNKVQMPFDQLVIFSTNINPKDLLDEAFMRRLRHKVFIGPLDPEGFRENFVRTCKGKGIEFREEVYADLIKEVYEAQKRPFTACHPRDLLDHLTDLAKFEGRKPEMTKDLLLRACESYFVGFEEDDSRFATSAGVADLLK
jgi:hypothetical protein